MLTRAPEGRGRNLERELQGWRTADDSPCSLSELDSLRGIFEGKGRAEVRAKHFFFFLGLTLLMTCQHVTSDVTSGVSFNLKLTPEQRESRAKVPLPYAHKGHSEKDATQSSGAILYDPDSADDIDDDDPDEDLDI